MTALAGAIVGFTMLAIFFCTLGWIIKEDIGWRGFAFVLGGLLWIVSAIKLIEWGLS